MRPDISSSKSNQFLIRASGGVGIGTDNPASALDVADDQPLAGHVNHNAIRLTSASYMGNHPFDGVGYYGQAPDVPFAGEEVGGPVLYGYSGGALGSTAAGNERIALRWTEQGQVGIGMTILRQLSMSWATSS